MLTTEALRPKTPVAAHQEWRVSLPKTNTEILVRVYSGRHTSPRPGMLFLHGGFFNCGMIEDIHGFCEALVDTAVVISIDYPLAPQAVFPQAIEAVFSMLEWVADNAHRLNIDPLRLFIGGHQAGGNMAVAVAMMSRDRLYDRPRKRKLVGQILVSPLLDPMLTSLSLQGTDMNSYQHGWNDYLTRANDFQHPYAAPLWSRRLINLPKALLVTSHFDPFRDETSCFAKKLASSGIKAQLYRLDATSNCIDFGKAPTELQNHAPIIRSFLFQCLL